MEFHEVVSLLEEGKKEHWSGGDESGSPPQLFKQPSNNLQTSWRTNEGKLEYDSDIAIQFIVVGT